MFDAYDDFDVDGGDDDGVDGFHGDGVRPGYTGLYTWHIFPRIRVGTWPTPYICCKYS
jgi:hypothetical protein